MSSAIEKPKFKKHRNVTSKIIGRCQWRSNKPRRLHRCWWRMLETKYVGDNFEMLVTVLADFVTNILYLLALASGTNIQKMSPILKFRHQHPQIVTNIKSPTSTCHQRLCRSLFGSYCFICEGLPFGSYRKGPYRLVSTVWTIREFSWYGFLPRPI